MLFIITSVVGTALIVWAGSSGHRNSASIFSAGVRGAMLASR
jgi:hypothetical protein